jgi:ATP-dependent DNA helicase PIF1
VEEGLLFEPTKLFPTKTKVEYINNTKMDALIGEEKTYSIKPLIDLEMSKENKYVRSQYNDNDIKTELDYLTRNVTCDINITLKIGCQVMCIVNMELDDGQVLCNGSQGIVTGFIGPVTILVKFNELPTDIPLSMHTWASERSPGLGVSQLPIILAWAITIHKSQGASLDMAEIDVGSDIFECGQTYVALSRVRSLEGLFLKSFDLSKILINKKVQEFYSNLHP